MFLVTIMLGVRSRDIFLKSDVAFCRQIVGILTLYGHKVMMILMTLDMTIGMTLDMSFDERNYKSG